MSTINKIEAENKALKQQIEDLRLEISQLKNDLFTAQVERDTYINIVSRLTPGSLYPFPRSAGGRQTERPKECKIISLKK